MMKDVHPVWITAWLVIIVLAAMSPMYLFAKDINEDEYVKTICGAVTAGIVGASGAGVIKAVNNRKK